MTGESLFITSKVEGRGAEARQPGGCEEPSDRKESQSGTGKFLVKPVHWFRYTGALKRKTDLSWPSVGAEDFLERGECCAELCYGPWWRGFC